MSQRDSGTSPWYRRHAFWLLLAIAAYFLWAEHRAHVVAFLPLALVAACVGIHLFMHGSHGHGGHGSRDTARETDPSPTLQSTAPVPDAISTDVEPHEDNR